MGGSRAEAARQIDGIIDDPGERTGNEEKPLDVVCNDDDSNNCTTIVNVLLTCESNLAPEDRIIASMENDKPGGLRVDYRSYSPRRRNKTSIEQCQKQWERAKSSKDCWLEKINQIETQSKLCNAFD